MVVVIVVVVAEVVVVVAVVAEVVVVVAVDLRSILKKFRIFCLVDLAPRTNYEFSDLLIMRTVGTGTFGRVKMVCKYMHTFIHTYKHTFSYTSTILCIQVQYKPSGQVCALKCMNKTEVIASHQVQPHVHTLIQINTCSAT